MLHGVTAFITVFVPAVRYNAEAANALIRRHQQDSDAAKHVKPAHPKQPRGAHRSVRVPPLKLTADAETATLGEPGRDRGEGEEEDGDSSFHGHILERVHAMLNEQIQAEEADQEADEPAG